MLKNKKKNKKKYKKKHFQWNRIEDPEMNPHTYGHLIFHQGAKTTTFIVFLNKQICIPLFNKSCMCSNHALNIPSTGVARIH
jgi:hypothetical protein